MNYHWDLDLLTRALELGIASLLRLFATVPLILAVALCHSTASADVFYAKDEALKRAFPDAQEIIPHTYILSPEDIEYVEAESGTKIENHLVTFFEGRSVPVKGDNGEQESHSLGFAVIDSGIVRTMPQTYMVVLTPDGAVKSTFILAFHEPLEYLPPEKWLEQFENRRLVDSLRTGGDVNGILGSTLSVESITHGIRRVLALYQRLCVSS